MPGKSRKKRVPQLKYTKTRNIGWHVSYRDPAKGTPRKHRFDATSRGEAEQAYHEWVAAFLHGMLPETTPRRKPRLEVEVDGEEAPLVATEIVEGSLLHVASSLLRHEEARVRGEGEPRRQGSISENLYVRRKQYSKEFLEFINGRYESGAVGRMRLANLLMEDVEAYNRSLVKGGYSQSQVSKRLRFLKAMIDRAGRPEHGSQILTWNWDSRDKMHGKPPVRRELPTLKQLKLVLKECTARESAMVWMAIGCGFGQRDLSAVRVGQIDKTSYDLRRGKTGIDRYGETPLMVWRAISAYLKTVERKPGELMFTTRKSMPLVHDNTDAVAQWWTKLREIGLLALVWRPMVEVKRWGRLFVDGVKVSVSYHQPEQSRSSAPSASLRNTGTVPPKERNEKKITIPKNSFNRFSARKENAIAAFAAKFCPNYRLKESY